MQREEPVRLREGPAVVRRRLAELVVRRPPRPHRVLHQRRAAAARGPAGRPRRRRPAVPGAERDRRQRVAAGRAPLPRPGPAVRDPAGGRDAAHDRPAQRVLRQREQRPGRHHAGQRPARPAPAGRRDLLPQPRLRRAARRPDHRGAHGGAAARQARRRRHPADPGRHRAAGRGVLRAADRRGPAAGPRLGQRRSCGRWRTTRRSSRRSSDCPPGTTRRRPGSRRGTTRPT